MPSPLTAQLDVETITSYRLIVYDATKCLSPVLPFGICPPLDQVPTCSVFIGASNMTSSSTVYVDGFSLGFSPPFTSYVILYVIIFQLAITTSSLTIGFEKSQLHPTNAYPNLSVFGALIRLSSSTCCCSTSVPPFESKVTV